jgi:hypothetical protein
MLPLTVSSFTLGTVNTAQLTKVVSQQSTGSILAVDMSLSSLSGLLAPMVSTIVLERHGIRGVGSTCAGIVGMVAVIMFVTGVGAASPEYSRKVS